MKKLFTLFITGLFAVAITAQAPQKMSFQEIYNPNPQTNGNGLVIL